MGAAFFCFGAREATAAVGLTHAACLQRQLSKEPTSVADFVSDLLALEDARAQIFVDAAD